METTNVQRYTLTLAGLASALLLISCSGDEPVLCNASETLCGTACVTLDDDPRHCGACNTACSTGEVCVDGACGVTCPTGHTECGGACRDLETDRAHCGACDTACGAGEACVSGACTTTCPAGQDLCGGGCYDLETANDHCGDCATACGAGEVCVAGACSASCPTGQDLCDAQCFDLQTASAHCGDCGTACGAGEVCRAGGCETQCPTGQTVCGGACFDTASDAEHCGDCDTACGVGQFCVAGACATNCPPGQAACGAVCTSTTTDPAHCGDCNTTCGVAEACVGGACTPSCGVSLLLCDGACRDIRVDSAHCGGCGVACPAGQACSAGSCSPACGPGQLQCGNACTNVQTDEANCGGCGQACGANELCAAGICTLSCAGATPADCNGTCTSTQADPNNCGGCGVACTPSEVCSAGACQGACGVGLVDCGGSCVSIQDDPANCGGCGVVCTAASGATGVCSAGVCGEVCVTGRADCDGDLLTSGSNGCEALLALDPGNCGTCGNACLPANGTGGCAAGVCAVATCNPGFDDCDNNPANGCEANLQADDNHCAACGIVCGSGTGCSAGVCFPGGRSGEDCTGPILLLAGNNTYSYIASTNDYMTGIPSCGANYAASGGDVVFEYDADFNGFIDVTLAKPASTRYHMVVGPPMCGQVLPEVVCVSDFTNTTMGFQLAVTQGSTYFVYLVDSTSGTNPLPDPLDVTVVETSCATIPPVTLVSSVPSSGTAVSDWLPSVALTFSAAVQTNVGTITLTGSLGTTQTYDLATSPLVTFGTSNTVVTVNPAQPFRSGETVTVSWSGLVEPLCGTAVAAVSPALTFSIPAAPCTPGVNGMIGGNITRIPTGLRTAFTEYYVEADEDPNGWVYVGGTANLYRFSKQGGLFQDIEDVSRSGPISLLGYSALVDGGSVYVLDDTTSTTLPITGRLTRVTSNGGLDWGQEDIARWPTVAPQDDVRSPTVYNGRIYMLTGEATSTVDTEIWSIPVPGTPLVDAVLEGGFGGAYYCSGLAVDSTYYYTTCASPSDQVVRIAKAGFAVTTFPVSFDFTTTIGTVHGVDADNDGLFDYLYMQGWKEEAYVVCEPDSGAPFFSTFFKTGTGTSQYGLGFDRANNTLWMTDDATNELIRIQ
ncbi:MAG: hypothetical protein H6730_11510 [Deltaproteobacteria bacterium]|nr:hypothetical protein [Deltaproteobacteria bacterium]